MYTIKNWLYTFLDEKDIDLETPITVTSLHDGTENHMIVQHVVDFILRKPVATQKSLQMKLITIDFRNGDVMDFFKYVARFMAVNLTVSQ